MKIAVFMDDLANVKSELDTTLAMLSRAHARGWTCSYFTFKDLFAKDGEVFADLTHIVVDDTFSYWKEQHIGVEVLTAFDIILIRKDPPFDAAYLYATQMLELVARQGVLVTNKPQSLRDHNEKLSLLQYPELCPPTLVSANLEGLHAFWHEHQSIILKPLDAMGGQSIFHVDKDGRNLRVILELLTAKETQCIMAQRYIPEIQTEGDKRIILINGEPCAHALARFPASGESRANLAVGGTGKVVPITDHDRDLCAALAPRLIAQELYFVGVDVIGGYVTEINVTSPTCVRQIAAASGVDIIGMYLDFLEASVDN
ncbi:MAG: glutathione synthase [Gammaproteobacteria bacterium]|nr:glutathione synthase [Gammaproteobacteria bacterium]